MTDRQTYTDRDGDEVNLYGDPVGEDVLGIFAPRSILIPAAELLAMIDRAAPDAMRAYLRETAPEVIADLYRPAPAAADHFDYLDPVPEADSPEDVDEPAVIELSDDIDTRLHVIERLAKILRAGTDAVEVCTLADWVIDR